MSILDRGDWGREKWTYVKSSGAAVLIPRKRVGEDIFDIDRSM
jgi:hypothetical protein